MKITNLTSQKKDENRVNIFIEGKYSFSLSLQEVLDEKIKVGIELDEHDITRLKKISSDGKLKMRMVEWLALRPRSERELKDYLRRKSVDEELQTTLINTAQKYNWQNDETFTKWWIEQRTRKKRSKTFIVSELRSKGISSDIIDASFADAHFSESEQLKELIAKKRTLTKFTDDKKLTEYLIRQGFRYSDIVDALAE
ncbi:MAG: regulatory protein RecX [Candidatus Saccharimonadales bacterium]